MAEKQNLEAYWEEILSPKKRFEELFDLEDDTLAALNLEESVFANADLVEDPRIANEFALVAWEDEVSRGVHPPLRRLKECKELQNFPACRPCTAWKLDGEQACLILM